MNSVYRREFQVRAFLPTFLQDNNVHSKVIPNIQNADKMCKNPKLKLNVYTFCLKIQSDCNLYENYYGETHIFVLISCFIIL